MIELTGAQRREVCLAIQGAFDRFALEQVISFELNVDLETIVSGCNDSQVTFKLVRWSEEQGCVVQLLKAVCAERPGNSKLQAIAQQFLQQPKQEQSTNPPRFQFPEPCDFDLTGLIEDTLPHLHGKQGLVGFAIPCMEETFRVRFCERLQKELGRRQNIKIRQPLQLDPYASMDRIAARIQQYENDLLKDKDVICPMPISIFEPDSKLPDELWQRLSQIFKDTSAKRRLILFMYGRENAVFPKGLLQIQPPEFKGVHVLRWVVRMSEVLGWQEHVWEQWRKHMMDCCCDGTATDVLDIRLAYEHLDVAMALVQRQVSPEEFIQELRSGF